MTENKKPERRVAATPRLSMRTISPARSSKSSLAIIAEAYERRERLEALVYLADASRTAAIGAIRRIIEQGHPTDPTLRTHLAALRSTAVLRTRSLIELSVQLDIQHRLLRALLKGTPP